MRNHSTPLYKSLAAAGLRAPTVTPSTSVEGTTFNLIGLPSVLQDMRTYAMGFLVRVTTTFDADAAGDAVNWDKLYKGVNGFRLFSPILGEQYQLAHARGAVVGHIYQVLAGGYAYPQCARAQIATNTDQDVTIDLYYVLPLSFEFLIKPHETAPFVGLFEQGELDVRIAASDVFNADYAGAVLKSPTTVRAWLEYLPSPDNAIAVPFQFREYTVPGNSTEFVLRGVGGGSGLKGIAPNGCGLVALFQLCDAAGLGLGGAMGADEISRVDIPFRGQQSVDGVDQYFLALRRQAGHRVGPVSGTGTTIIHDGAGWPYAMAATPNNTAANGEAMFVPFVTPGRNFETSKAQHVKGDITINESFSGATPSGTQRFVTLELLEYDEPQLLTITRAMGVDPSTITPQRKLANGAATSKQIRYTRILL